MTKSPADPQDPRAEDAPRPALGRGGSRRAGALRRSALPAALLMAALATTWAAAAVRTPDAAPPKPAAAPAAKPDAQPADPPASKPADKPAAAAAAGAPGADEPAEKAFKNIKVLQGMPASQMAPVMHVMRASLGVRCDYCHVLEGDRYDLDTKPAKEAARDMLRMVMAINKENFAGNPEVTCQTCHHGKVHPDRAPTVELGLLKPIVAGEPAPWELPADLPTGPQLLDRYIAALGGRPALEAVHSRVSRGTLLRLGIAEAGTPKARGVNRGQEDPLEIVQKGPDQIVMTYGQPGQEIVQTLNGKSGTLKTPQGERPLVPEEVARMASRGDLRRDLQLVDQAAKARVVGKDQIDGREVIQLRMRIGDNPALLSFDAQTNLLRRQIVYKPTYIGPEPEQTDYEDYRDVGGVKVPFLIKASYLDDLHYGTTRKLTEVRNNVDK